MRDRPQLDRDQPEVLPFQATDDLSDEPALDAVRLHNDKGAIHERRTVAVAATRGVDLPPLPGGTLKKRSILVRIETLTRGRGSSDLNLYLRVLRMPAIRTPPSGHRARPVDQ
jgi:hypothetical protein